MPLSKKRQAEYQKGRRNRLKTVIPKTGIVIPNNDALQSISRGSKGEGDSTLPPVSVQPSDEDIIKVIETLDNAPVPTDNRLVWTEDDGVQPNCP